MKTPVHLLPYFARQPIEQATLDEIEKCVCEHFRVTKEQLHAPRRLSRVVWPRQVCMFLMDELVDNSMMQIGKHFDKDHSTVVYACKTVKAFMHFYPDVKAAIAKIKEELGKELAQ